MYSELKAIDLFCGCGGLTQGLKQAGFTVLGAVDNNPLAILVYCENHPETKVWVTDIQKLSVHKVLYELSLDRGELDLLAGCPPCQGFSSMRTLNGSRCIDDKRNDLLYEFIRFIEVIQPKTIMLENVPGLEKDSRFTEFKNRMGELGYLGNAAVLDAAEYSVPQRRRRLIYLAGKGFTIPFATGMKVKKTVGDTIQGLPEAGKSGDRIHDLPEGRTKRIKDMIKLIPKNGGSRTDLPADYQLECHKKCNGFKDVYGRMSWDNVAPTITSGCFNPSKGRFIHPEEDRAITMREAALLQGFPVTYRFTATKKIELAKMIGNALPPPFIKAHANMIKKHIQTH